MQGRNSLQSIKSITNKKMKKLLLVLAVALVTQAAWCADTQTIVYPTEESASFMITAPDDWEMKQAEEEGDYFHLQGPSGAVFSFRTIEGSSDSMEQAINEAMEELREEYKDAELGEAQDWTPGGLKGFYATGTAVDKQDDAKVRVGMGWVALEDGKIAEFWFVADLDDEPGMSAAEKIANSLKAP